MKLLKQKAGYIPSKDRVLITFLLLFTLLEICLFAVLDDEKFVYISVALMLFGGLQRTGKVISNRLGMMVSETYANYYFFIVLIMVILKNLSFNE